MVDLSHTTDATAVQVSAPWLLGQVVNLTHSCLADAHLPQAIEISHAPVIWSHSGARAVHSHPRNVPDDVLAMIGDGPGRNKGIV